MDYYDEYEYLLVNNSVKRPLADLTNPMELFRDGEFEDRYPMRKITVHFIVQQVDFHRRRCGSVPSVIQLCVTLRFYATGTYQSAIADLHGIDRTTVCKIIKYVSRELAKLSQQNISFPTDLSTVKTKFRELSRIPNIIGAIDCTHIRIQSPGGENAPRFINRKGFFSLNVQAVVGPNYQFFDFVCRWPGSTHDAMIYRNSRVKQNLDSGSVDGILLGDSGYPCSKNLLTPLLTTNSPREERYNSFHRRARSVVERTFGVWKRRFSVLGPDSRVRLRIETVMNVCCACAFLHNTLLLLNDGTSINEISADNPTTTTAFESDNTSGVAFRRTVIDTFFA